MIDRGLRPAAGEIAGPALVADGGDLAIRISADADALDGRRPVRGVVENEGARQRHLHRPLGCARAEGCEHNVRAQKKLAAETAANEGRDKADVFPRDAKRCGQIAGAPVDHLRGGPYGEFVAVPGGGRRVRLHHRMRLTGRGVGRIELEPRCRKRAGEIAERRIGRTVKPDGFGRVFRRDEIEHPGGAHIVDAHQLRGGARLFEGFGDDDGDRLVIVGDVRTAEQLGEVTADFAQRTGIVSGDDGERAGRGLGFGEVN